MKKITHPFLFACTGLVLAAGACVQPPNYPVEPRIEFESLSKNTLLQSSFGQDSVLLTFNFTDGDGDLGFETATPSIFIVDGRDNVQDSSYSIPYISQEGAGNGISGTISLWLPTTCCIYPLNTGVPPCETTYIVPQSIDTLVYRIWIKDRAGHLSDTIETDPIILICKRQ